jgi:hypothetical protein
MWPVTFRDQGPQSSPAPPKAYPGPDYSALVDILLDLRQIPDWAGETVLDSTEAARIRTCGFTARAGLWRCPPMPWQFLGRYPTLWHLSDDIDSATRPVVWHQKRATFREISPIDPLSKHERQLLRLLSNAPGGRLTRRQLQQRVSRKVWTALLDYLLERLLAEDYITTTAEGWIYPFGRAQFEALEQQARQRCPKPLYAS